MIEIKKHVLNMNSEMWSIFDEHGGYDYNDEMLTQLEGLSISMSDCADRNFENVHDVYDDCLTTYRWFKYVERYRKAQDKNEPFSEEEPNSLYC